MNIDRTHYSKMDSKVLRSRFLSALDRSQRAETAEAYTADEFAMDEIWSALEARGEQHPCIRAIRFEAA